jgi:hypothetical protein
VADVKIDYKGEQVVANTCVGGKAQKVDVEFKKVDVGSLGTHEGDEVIRNLLKAQGLNFPKYDIMCLDASGNLHTGDTSGANDGSTVAKRPTEINPNATFHK